MPRLMAFPTPFSHPLIPNPTDFKNTLLQERIYQNFITVLIPYFDLYSKLAGLWMKANTFVRRVI